MAELDIISFESSNGTLLVNRDGSVHPSSRLSDWLLDIQKVDLEELGHYYKLQGEEGIPDDGDVLDFGYWDKEGEYYEAEKAWRIEVFHKPIYRKREVKRIVEKAYRWISENRKKQVT